MRDLLVVGLAVLVGLGVTVVLAYWIVRVAVDWTISLTPPCVVLAGCR